ncbi:hypothetical protein [Modestobacter excelsi]|uniref:hypothetical protein n=1 Tax=Modestobacter excelsi TaxID=2213161 RepID=UPI00110CFE94|nr:hypothetical protein [Modestobacter excelsi]
MTETNGVLPKGNTPPADPAAKLVDPEGTDLARLLDALSYTPDERLSICHALPDGGFSPRVLAPAEADAAVDRWRDVADVWWGVNPVSPTTSGRGSVAEVTRLAAIYADLDVKPGGLPTITAAWAVVADLATMLGAEPVAVIGSGHGLQPVWAIDPDDGDLTGDRRAAAVALLRRFGRLVGNVAERHGGQVDAVFDLARVLRVPGTVNRKAEPVPVTIEWRNGGSPC